MKNLIYFLFLGIFITICQIATPAQAQNAHAQASLISPVMGVGDKQELIIGLHIKLDKGWKTYWRSPGEGGLPPEISWEGSNNIQSYDMLWPAPTRFIDFGMETIGYQDEVLFPIRITPTTIGEAIDIKSDLRLLICKDICVPFLQNLSLQIPKAPAFRRPDARLIDDWVAKVPTSQSGLQISSAAQKENGSLMVELSAPFDLKDVDLFIETNEHLAFAAPVTELGSDPQTAIVTLTPITETGSIPRLSGQEITITAVQGSNSAQASLNVAARPAAPTPETTTEETKDIVTPVKPEASLLFITLIAFVGGMILNLMPCVLPVLSLKLLSIIDHGDSEPHEVRKSFLHSAAGIVFSFLVLAIALIGLKEAGQQVGWGIQFQQPLFLTFMILVLSLFTYNLFGLFDINLPMQIADKLAHVKLDHFATGAFATLLATPCSAPFLGPAVGFALAHGTSEILLIFTSMGLGLALPYLLVALFPKAVKLIPRPGHWMDILRKILALALAVTALWLLSVLASQVGWQTSIIVLGFMLALGVVLWEKRWLAQRFFVWLGIVIIGCILVVMHAPVPEPAEHHNTSPVNWVVFAQEDINAHVKDGRIVFVDVTADWCITCKSNKKLVMEADEIVALLNADHVIAMQADWTTPDTIIGDFLHSYGRFGIPFNIVYGPGAPDGIILSELLSKKEVRSALDKAK